MTVIDLNSDVGESFGNWKMGDDAAVFESVSSANVACGFHAGDPSTIARTCRDAVAAGVTIGAHPAYRDLAGFGRRFLDCSYTELFDDVLYQLGALQAMARAAGSEIRYVKPHGALYNTIVRHEVHAKAVIDAVRTFDKDLPVLLLPGAVALDIAAEAGLRGVTEAFADRNYNPDGTLVSRREANAVIHDAGQVTVNMVRLATQGTITAVDGTDIPMSAESICVHGDTPGAVAMAKAVRAGLENAGVTIQSFV
ncbi:MULTISPECIES: LamB/YcsF family protein [unclassified Arthrobacter]|uniref:LamB/YcsF family protein n=1 Tax=unclassified Arthrobacter TaxID=235627 RepID=UPI001D14845B|nr:MULTISPECIES: 5-oxoprolinase subunit PxpA [unclassified Arthrobacter]MCC3291737.1 LamB/YcsF family protein [Arthrobacter sp. zg-Y1110]MCC3302114.1 LamB/YcsF family protein [Arthrobacter sp. zg-Y895]UWX85577.1 LamB/YcsF family protein [Arthrobacter sp. zg-Y1110]